MITFNVITLFPELIQPHLANLPFKKAFQKNLIKVNLINLRDFAIDKRGTVDDKPYGGGTGMLLMIEPLYKAIKSIKNAGKIVLLSPSGKKYNQTLAKSYSALTDITLICGRYEGVDERIKKYVDETVSIGDFVLSGGEIPALAILESVTRLIPGVLEKPDATTIESFADDNAKTTEFPQYTRPEEFNGQKVPDVLLSGNHARIASWRENNFKLK